MLTIALDTSSSSGSTALVSDECVISEISFDVTMRHSERTISVIEKMLIFSGKTLKDIDFFTVTNGPGSFTGIRTGISAIMGLAFSLQKKYVATSTLNALAWNLWGAPQIIKPIIYARMGEVYTAEFIWNGRFIERRTTDMVLNAGDFCDTLKDNEEYVFAGNGVKELRDEISALLKNRARFAPCFLNNIRGAVLGKIGIDLVSEGKFSDSLSEINYIKPSQAEIINNR